MSGTSGGVQLHPRAQFSDVTRHVRLYQLLLFSLMTEAALPHLREGSAIINTTSVTAYKGSAHLLDYASTKGAIVSFTRSLSQALAEKNIRVNAVAPGPIWTPLLPPTFPPEKVGSFGSDVPLGRAGQPEEVAPSYAPGSYDAAL